VAAVTSAPVMRVLEREWIVWKRLWRGSTFSFVVSPLLFLAAMGLGLGQLVQKSTGNVDGVSYLEFVAPGLMAASAVMMAAGDSLWPVMAGVMWTAIRTGMSATVFLIVAAILGAIPSAWGVFAIPATVLGAVAIAAPLCAWSILQESDGAFVVVMRIVVFPLFLFSGTFFPISRLPDAIEWLAFLSPMWHAVELSRGATTGGQAGADTVVAVVVHVGALVAFVVAGWWWGVRTFHRILTQ